MEGSGSLGLGRLRARTITAVLLAGVFAATALGCSGTGPGSETPKDPRPRAVILIIGDGMGAEHLKALEEYSPQATEALGALPVRVDVATDPAPGSLSAGDGADPPVTDSAAAATAMATGQKTLNGYVGVNPDGDRLETIVEAAEREGFATGLVTSVPLSHATPAAFAAHTTDRNDYTGIARQLIEDSALDVLMGAGHPDFDADGRPSDEKRFFYVGGEEQWRDLGAGRAGGDADGDGDPDPWTLVDDRGELRTYAAGTQKGRLLFVAPVEATLSAERSGDVDVPFADPMPESVPTLAEMTRAALSVLDDDDKGFFLMVEAGAIDWMARDHDSDRTLEELVGLAEVLGEVERWVEADSSWDDTLVIVTGDHETGGLTVGPAGSDGVPKMEWSTRRHTGVPVSLYARGVGAERLGKVAGSEGALDEGLVDNTDINDAMRKALLGR